jgi:hypothetical protein
MTFVNIGILQTSSKITAIEVLIEPSFLSITGVEHVEIKVVESPKCAKCKYYDESVEHYLLHCKAYQTRTDSDEEENQRRYERHRKALMKSKQRRGSGRLCSENGKT